MRSLHGGSDTASLASDTARQEVVSRMDDSRPIGGFLGFELPGNDGGLRKLWGAHDERLAFTTARSALAHLLSSERSGAVWFPAYVCTEFARAVPADRLRYYPHEADLSPKLDFLHEMVRPGDLVIAVNFFGRPPSPAFLAYVSDRRDILFVEDCAQAIDTGRPPWGDWRLFSPRKVVGVPDGGILVPCSARAAALELAGSVRSDFAAVELATPQLARFEDEGEVHNDRWYGLNLAKESSLAISGRRISRLAWAVLGLLDADAIARKRRENFARLASRLAEWAFLPEACPEFVPLGFPVRLPPGQRLQVQEHLYRHRVFPAVHWAELASPPREFPDEHSLASTLLTLPCDHRYGGAEMDRVANLFLQTVGRT